jgi:hypothetical protein
MFCFFLVVEGGEVGDDDEDLFTWFEFGCCFSSSSLVLLKPIG